MKRYEDVFILFKGALDNGGRDVCIHKIADSDIWEVLVQSDNSVYLSYTIGEDNADFLFQLIEFTRKRNIPVNISYQ